MASTLEVLQRRQEKGEFQLDRRDSTYGRLQLVTGYDPRLFVADPEMGGDEAQPLMGSARCSALDLSLTPHLPLMDGEER